MSAKPLSANPSFPQLEIAKDPELMREVFQRHLRPLGKKAYQIRMCRAYRIRYEQALRGMLQYCILQYTLRVEEPDTGRERIQLVTGVMYARSRTRWIWEKLWFRWIREKLRRSDPGPGTTIASPSFAPFSYIPDLEMLVQVFPYDRRLRALPLLMAGAPPELEPLLLARFGPGDWRTEAWDVEAVRYMAEARATLRLTVRARDAATGRVEERRFYAKIYHNEEEGEQTYQVLRALWDRASAGGESFAVARPIAYLSGLRTLVQEEVLGITLKDMLLGEDEVAPAIRRVARALATLHLDRVATPRRRLPWEEKEVAILKKAQKLLQSACPHLRSEIEETVGAVVTGLEEVPLAPTHGDFKLGHILLDGDRLTLIDFDEFAEADPILDVAHVLSQLAAMPLRSLLPHDRAEMAARAFAEEYFAHVPEPWRARLPLQYAGAILKMAYARFRRQAPGWRENVETLLEEARDSLEGRVW